MTKKKVYGVTRYEFPNGSEIVAYFSDEYEAEMFADELNKKWNTTQMPFKFDKFEEEVFEKYEDAMEELDI